MIKKVLTAILCLCLVFGISAASENSTESTNTEQSPQVTEEIPMREGGEMRGGRRGMGPPREWNTKNGEVTPVPSGEIPPDISGFVQENEQMPEIKSENNIFDFVKTYSTPIFSMVLLIAAFAFVKLYKRKQY